MKLNQRQLEATARLLTTNDFKELMNAFGDYGEKQMEKLVYAHGDDIVRIQGQVQAITAIVKALGSATDTLSTIQARSKTQL